jgi:hypothetical protein
MKAFVRIACTTVALAGSFAAGAETSKVIFHQTTTEPVIVASNMSSNENFADPVKFHNGAWVTGINNYTAAVTEPGGVLYSYGAVGTQVLISIRLDTPTGTLTQIPATITSQIEEPGTVSNCSQGNTCVVVQTHADFPQPVWFTPGTTYWIGMSGNGSTELGQALFTGTADAMYNGPNFCCYEQSGVHAEFELVGYL